MTDEGAPQSDWRTRVDFRRRTSVATRLAVGILVVSILTIVTTVVVSSASVSSSSNQLLEVRIDTRASTAEAELEAYFRNLGRGLLFLGTSPALTEAAVEFGAAYRELGATADGLGSAQEEVGAFYRETYLPNLGDVRGARIDPTEFVPAADPAVTFLQAEYIARNPFEFAERRLLTDPGDDSSWTAIHAQAHRPIRELADQLGFFDLMLVDAASEAVVYSVNKDVAFGTSLVSGPHSGTSLAGLVRSVIDDPVPGSIEAADVAVYPPNLDNPTAFLATPMFREGTLVAILVGSLPFDEVNRIMTQDWVNGRFGDTGEVYLVGPDRTMRSDSRTLIEDPTGYLARIDELGSVTGTDRNRMEALDTSIIFQPVDSEAVQLGLSGQEGTLTVTNYLGTEVISSVRTIDGAAFDWIVLVEQEVAEAESPLTDYVRSTLVITVVFIVALTFVAVAWSSGFMAPIRAMSAALRDIRKGSDTTEVPVDGAAEFRTLAHHLGAMVESLRERQEEVLQAIRSKAAIVRTLMPDSAAARVDMGERHLVDTVPQASISVLVLDGLDDMVTSRDAATARTQLHELIDELDDLAEAHGLDRVKLKGDTYYAACGLNEPLIDHAPRTARFSQQAIAAVERFGDASAVRLVAQAGVASGSLAAGLVGTTGLVFDIWGTPVDEAFGLAHAASPGQVLLGRSARDRIPATVELVEIELPAGPAWAYGTDASHGVSP